MGYSSEFIERFSLIREITRQMFVKGYQYKEEYSSLANSTFNDRLKRIYNYLQDDLLFDYAHGERGKWITSHDARYSINPFYRLYKTKKIIPTDISFHFALLALHADPTKEFTREELFSNYNDLLQYDIPNHADSWKIKNISVNNVRLTEEKPVHTLINIIGEENYQKLRNSAIKTAHRKMNAAFYLLKNSADWLFVYGSVFRCCHNGMFISPDDFRHLCSENFYPYPFDTYIQYAKNRSQKRLLGKISIGNQEIFAVALTHHSIISVPDGKIYTLEDCRTICTEEQYQNILMRMFEVFEKLSETSIKTTVQDNTVRFTISKILSRTSHVPNSKKQSNSFNNTLANYLKIGLLSCRKEKNSYLYSFSSPCPYTDSSQGLMNLFPNLKDALLFFSEASPLGLIGNQIMDLCQLENTIFSFRDHYVSQALDSLLLHELLEAIRHKKHVRLFMEKVDQYINKEQLVQPIKIISDVQIGRQYLLCYHLENQSYQYCRLDLIRHIKIEPSYPWSEEISSDVQQFLPNVWSNRLWKHRALSLDVQISYDPKSEFFVRNRLYRECRIAQPEETSPGMISLKIQAFDPLEAIPWLLSFTGRVHKIMSPASKAAERFRQHICGMYQIYNKTPDDTPLPMVDPGHTYNTVEEEQPKSKEGKRLTVTAATDSPLFLNIVNSYIVCYDNILRHMDDKQFSKGPLESLINETVKKYAFRHTAEDRYLISLESMLENRLIYTEDNQTYMSSFGHLSFRPFTLCEKNFLYTVANDPRMQLFLTVNEIAGLKSLLGDCTQLYDSFYYQTVGVCNDGDPFSDINYQIHFVHLMKAIKASLPVTIKYITNATGIQRQIIVWPLRLEYSQTRNKFSVYCMDQKGTPQIIRLSTILSVTAQDEIATPSTDINWKNCIRKLTVKDEDALEVLVSTEANALERFMLEFQVYRKESHYDKNANKCRIKIWYLSNDYQEMIVKLLRFGKAAEVLSPVSVRREIKRRVTDQYKLFFDTQEA